MHPTAANFVLVGFAEGDGRSAPAASGWLERHGILARPMAAYGLPHCLRITVGREADNRMLLERLREFMA